MAWDAALGLDERANDLSGEQKPGEDVLAGPITSGGRLLDLIVYPQNMPNTPPVNRFYSLYELDNAYMNLTMQTYFVYSFLYRQRRVG